MELRTVSGEGPSRFAFLIIRPGNKSLIDPDVSNGVSDFPINSGLIMCDEKTVSSTREKDIFGDWVLKVGISVSIRVSLHHQTVWEHGGRIILILVTVNPRDNKTANSLFKNLKAFGIPVLDPVRPRVREFRRVESGDDEAKAVFKGGVA